MADIPGGIHSAPASLWMGPHVTEESSGRLEGFPAFAARRRNHGGKRAFSPFLNRCFSLKEVPALLRGPANIFLRNLSLRLLGSLPPSMPRPFSSSVAPPKTSAHSSPITRSPSSPVSNPYLATPCLSRFISASPPLSAQLALPDYSEQNLRGRRTGI